MGHLLLSITLHWGQMHCNRFSTRHLLRRIYNNFITQRIIISCLWHSLILSTFVLWHCFLSCLCYQGWKVLQCQEYKQLLWISCLLLTYKTYFTFYLGCCSGNWFSPSVLILQLVNKVSSSNWDYKVNRSHTIHVVKLYCYFFLYTQNLHSIIPILYFIDITLQAKSKY